MLLSGTDKRREEQVVLAYQRYGRGKSLAFPIQDSYLWKMDFKMPVEDMTHASRAQRVDPRPVVLLGSQIRVQPRRISDVVAVLAPGNGREI